MKFAILPCGVLVVLGICTAFVLSVVGCICWCACDVGGDGMAAEVLMTLLAVGKGIHVDVAVAVGLVWGGDLSH